MISAGQLAASHAGVELDAGVAGSTRRGEGQRAPLVGGWLPVEADASADDILVFAADQLQAAASAEGGRLRALPHRVGDARRGHAPLPFVRDARAASRRLQPLPPRPYQGSMDACPVLCDFRVNIVVACAVVRL